MKKFSIIFILLFWTHTIFSQPQPKEQQVSNENFYSTASTMEEPPPPPPLGEVPIDGGLLFLILSALGLGANRVKHLIRNGKDQEN